MNISATTLYLNERTPTGGLREFLTVLFKHKSRIAAVLLLFVLIGLVLSFCSRPSTRPDRPF